MDNQSVNSPDSVPEKVPELWFTDADVVFQAGAKLFRVHRSILSARSTVFKDMFSVPHPNGERVVNEDDSYTHIHLPDDATDVEHFFLAIFDASYFEPPPSRQPTSVAVPILRLAHKYDVIFLKHRAVAHLNVLFPTKWDDTWMLVNTKHRAGILTLLEVAPVVEIPWVLPAVNFFLMHATINGILPMATWNSLSLSIQQKYIIDRENCISKLSFLSSWIWGPPTTSCLFVATCTVGYELMRNTGVWRSLRVLPGLCCEECVKAVDVQCYTSGKQFWDNLPKIIGLGSWEDLAAAKDSYGN